MGHIRKIYNGHIVTPQGVIHHAELLIEGDKIVDIRESNQGPTSPEDIDARGSWILPGLIDTHSDAIELEIQPRPGSHFSLQLSFYELERKLVSKGITTIYHSMSAQDGNTKKWARRNEVVLDIIEGINELKQRSHLIRHKVHLRYEINNVTGVELVKQMITAKKIDQLSFMDHTPGQGQFHDPDVHRNYLIQHRHMKEDEVDQHIATLIEREKVSLDRLQELADLAHDYQIPLASHDDDSVEKLDDSLRWKARISEFPIHIDVARVARELGLFVVMGAPNVLLGHSHSNNLSAREAMEEGLVDILCSDYYPSSLLHAIFLLKNQGYDWSQTVNMVTLNPAKALGIDRELGSLEAGKQADLLIVRELNQAPVLEKVFVAGNLVCQFDYDLGERIK